MRFLLALIASIFLAAVPAMACSMAEGYKIPTNFELVQRAEVIVLARVKAVPPSWQAGSDRSMPGMVTLEPVRFLKGSAPDALELMGWRPPKNWEGVPTTTTLAQSHFSAGLGACIRQFYTPGELVVAMFERDPRMKAITGNDLNQISDAWSRAVETVDEDGDIWVRAVEQFVELQNGPASTLSDRIRLAISRKSSVHTPEAQAIAFELGYQLDRKDPSTAWTSFAMPTGTAAYVHGKKGAGLHCAAGVSPGILINGPLSSTVEIVIDGKAFAALPAKPTALEEQMMRPEMLMADPETAKLDLSLYHIKEPESLWAELQASAGEVSIKGDGQALVAGQPLDALYRWARQCQKLRSLPAPDLQESAE